MGVRVVLIIAVGGLLGCVVANSEEAAVHIDEIVHKDEAAQTPKSQESSGNSKTPLIKLVDEPHCKEDIQRVCRNDVRNNFAVLECLQNEKRSDKGVISELCNHLLWTYKLNLTQSDRIEDLAKNVCDSDLSNNDKIQCKDTRAGHTISCMTEHLNLIKDERCHAYLVRLAAIVFSDYRLVEDMTQKCVADIAKFKCGRLESNQTAPHSQGVTIECLGKHVQELNADCHKEILRLSELQADDFHLDRALFFACRYDREQFCENIRAGDGKVYKCLMKHKANRKMSTECAEQLTRRQELVAQDYRVSKGLVNACRLPIKENFCRRGAGDDEHDVKLSKILLCLENALRKGKHLEGSCQEEMLSHRRMLMEDYKLSPDLVAACGEEVKSLCHAGLEADGRTLHCLMKHARNHRSKGKIGENCRHQVELLVKEADAGEDWRADPVLYEACQPMVEASCKDLRGGQARVMRCLMRHLQSPSMPSECEAALLEIQYFVARDWKLDPQLYTACYNDSVKFCQAKKDWHDTSNADNVDKGAMVLPCLFRYAYHPKDDHRLIPTCLQEVKRVMSERAAYVELHPEIERLCMHDLANQCSENTGPGEEIVCLQDNLEKLDGECKSVVSNYTEAEAKDAGLNALLQMHCTTVVKRLCAGEAEIEGGLMQCLISHKNSQVMRDNNKCRAVVENFQILSLKDISFSPKFKDECQADVAQFCNKPKPKTKLDVLDCLSTSVREDILKDIKPRISRSCRQQLRQQLLQRHESINLDPKLRNKCDNDIRTKCSDVEKGGGKILECLRSHKEELSLECHKSVFVREQEEHLDPGTDVVLANTCRQMISRFCQDAQPQNLLTCLKSNRGAPDFEGRCRMLVTRRLVEQSTDQRLNPELRKACKVDMAKFCSGLFEMSMKSKVEFNGKVTECLKIHLPSRKLSGPCAAKMVDMMHSAALNYKLDPILQEKCMGEMKKLCPDTLGSDGQGSMEECMKLQFESNKILDDGCRDQIAKLIEVQHADIHMDPLLHRDCSQDDTKFCADEEHGEHLACLLDVLQRNPSALSVRCREKLRIRREMYQAALKVTRLESVQDVVDLVKASPQKNYFIVIFLMGIAIIFVGGLFCGRTTKRYKLLKDR